MYKFHEEKINWNKFQEQKLAYNNFREEQSARNKFYKHNHFQKEKKLMYKLCKQKN